MAQAVKAPTLHQADVLTLAHRVQVRTIPKQSNSHDCGPFVLTYLEYFAANPPVKIAPAFLDSPELNCHFPGHLECAPLPCIVVPAGHVLLVSASTYTAAGAAEEQPLRNGHVHARCRLPCRIRNLPDSM